MLALTLAVGVIARALRVPYTVGLVVAGAVAGALVARPVFALTPELVLFVFLPALLFAGAFTLPLRELRAAWLPIALFATVGIFIGIAVAWSMLTLGAGVPVRAALVFGAIVAATDPVAVLAVVRALCADQRLATIFEGESLFNDATAVTALRVLLGGVAGGAVLPAVGFGAVSFVVALAGGVLVGAAIGFVATLLVRQLDDYLLEATATTLTAYGSYAAAEALHASGIVAVICAALAMSGIGTRAGAFTEDRRGVNQYWQFVAFVANSALFLLLGLSTDWRALGAVWPAVAWGVAAMFVGRALAIYGLSALAALLGSPLPAAWQHGLAAGGLRGALSVALALGLPDDLPEKPLVVPMVFFCVLFTLVVQGLALGPVLARLGVGAHARGTT